MGTTVYRQSRGDGYEALYVDLPMTVNGLIAASPGGEALILINSRLSEEEQEEALRHELRHLRRGDLWRDELSIKEIEIAADRDDCGAPTLPSTPS